FRSRGRPVRSRFADLLVREFALDRVRLFSSPRAEVDPQRVAGDLVVTVDCLGKGDIEKLAPELLALAAPSHPEGEVPPDVDLASVRRVGAPFHPLRPFPSLETLFPEIARRNLRRHHSPYKR